MSAWSETGPATVQPSPLAWWWMGAAALLGAVYGLCCVTSWILGLLAPAAIAVGAVALWRPEAGWRLLIAFLFLASNYIPPSVTIPVFWAGVGLFLLGCWMENSRWARPVWWADRWWWSWSLAWIGWALVSSLHALEWGLSFKEVARYALCFVVFLTYLNWLNAPDRARRALDWLETVLVAAAAVCVWQAIRQHAATMAQGEEVRLGPYPPNVSELAVCFAGLLPIRLSRMLASRPRGVRVWGGLAAMAVLGLAVAISGSRSACFAVGVGLAAVCWMWSPPRLRRLAAIGTVVLAGVGSCWFIYRVLHVDSPVGPWAFLSGRDRIWAAAIRAIADHPWLGVGPGNWSVWFGKQYFSVDFLFHDAQNNTFTFSPDLLRGEAHQLLLTKGAEMGVISILLLVGLLARWFQLAWRATAQAVDPWARAVSAGCVASMVGWVAFAMFENGPIIGRARGAEVVMVWLIAAVPLAASRWRSPGRPTSSEPSPALPQ